MALREMALGLRGHIMSISGRFTGIGIEGTRPLAEQAESLLLVRFWLFCPEVALLDARVDPELFREGGWLEEVEDEESCLSGALFPALGGTSLMVTVLAVFDMTEMSPDTLCCCKYGIYCWEEEKC